MLEHTSPSLIALAGIELALEHVTLAKPLSKADLSGLQSECLDAKWPFQVLLRPLPGAEVISLEAQAVDNKNWGDRPLFSVHVSKAQIFNMVCGDLSGHEDSLEGADEVHLAMVVVMRKARAFATHFSHIPEQECFLSLSV
jgi:hypothetical protein